MRVAMYTASKVKHRQLRLFFSEHGNAIKLNLIKKIIVSYRDTIVKQS